jgi:hypothetical protein
MLLMPFWRRQHLQQQLQLGQVNASGDRRENASVGGYIIGAIAVSCLAAVLFKVYLR